MHLREYARTTRTSSQLAHVTVIEEAHRLAAASAHQADRETMADTRASGPESLSMTLSEIRAYGEGLIIAEQIPSRLVADALKNTNIKIVHRLPGKDDRDAIGGTMNLGTEQEPYLSKLAPGQAAFFTEGFERPTFINVPNYRAEHDLPDRVPDERVGQAMTRFRESNRTLLLPFDGCTKCVRQCEYRDSVTGDVYELSAAKKFAQALYVSTQQRQSDESMAWMELAKACREIISRTTLKNDEHALYCCFVHLWGKFVSLESSSQFRQAFRRITPGG